MKPLQEAKNALSEGINMMRGMLHLCEAFSASDIRHLVSGNSRRALQRKLTPGTGSPGMRHRNVSGL